jgi:glycerate dehydrogenase
MELDGLTMGVMGYGQIGQAVARIAQGFGMKVLIHTTTSPDHASGRACAR